LGAVLQFHRRQLQRNQLRERNSKRRQHQRTERPLFQYLHLAEPLVYRRRQPTSPVLTMINRGNGRSTRSASRLYRVSMNRGGSVALAFVQNSELCILSSATDGGADLAYSGGPSTWPKAAVDCEPQTDRMVPFPGASPDHTDATGSYYGAPLSFDHPVQGGIFRGWRNAYILSCGLSAEVPWPRFSALPTAPMIFLLGQQSGLLPTQSAISSVALPGGASNALVDSSTLYVVASRRCRTACLAATCRCHTASKHVNEPEGDGSNLDQRWKLRRSQPMVEVTTIRCGLACRGATTASGPITACRMAASPWSISPPRPALGEAVALHRRRHRHRSDYRPEQGLHG